MLVSILASLARLAGAPLVLLALLAVPASAAEAMPEFRIGWSTYVGWMPWEYARRSGILDRWASRYGIRITLTRVDDYVESINRYTAGRLDGCVMTNVDLLSIPAAGGVDSTALIVGDFSNGNDGIVLKGAGRQLADIKGRSVNLVELSVSHYVLARALETVGLRERDVSLINTSDADILGAWAAPATVAAVTWKPQLAEIAASPDASLVFDSSRLPGEILDLLVVKTDLLRESPALGKALVGAWYETMAVMAGKGADADEAIATMAEASGTDAAGFRAQLATTRLFTSPADAHALLVGPDLERTTDLVRRFSAAHGLFGDGRGAVDAVGIAFPSGRTLGNPRNVRVRFDASWTRLALEGSL